MGNESKPNKPHYDITLSRRTRKPQSRARFGEKVSALNDNDEDKEVEKEKGKKFIDIISEKEEDPEYRSSLGEHFTEEDNQLQLVVKQHEKGDDGASLKKMVSRCAKMWGHMIKIKGGSRKKRVLHLTM
ncbi:hypothetical protein L1887_18299 [Cichorium endivia]|nr:hypothetical protein L1887_18299 [Cichorium endivia]